MIAKNEAQQLGDPRMLEKIDKLFACNVGEYVNLPQIVVVGDQSSGKSSVLEGLIVMPLPRDSGLCTRFATRIVFRRSNHAGIKISLIPDTQSTTEHHDRLKAWKKEVNDLDGLEFVAIMNEVPDVMGLARKLDRSFEAGPIFSRDVLQLEISGPEQAHLSVVDVPGIFKNTSGGTTTKADMQLVESMVRGYMENPRSVMLAVVPANVDIATQSILEMVKEFDPEGRRTIGVLTKPDLVDKGAETAVTDLIEGRAHSMRFGWHLVRNPGQQQLNEQHIDRGSLEKIFFRDTSPWNTLDLEKLGTDSLQHKLQEILSDLVRHEFPNVRTEVMIRLKSAQEQLQKLGMERDTPERQSLYLIQLATNFQRLVALSIEAKYGKDDFFEHSQNLRLATVVMQRGEDFSTDLHKFGQSYSFPPGTGTAGAESDDELPTALSWKKSRKNHPVLAEDPLNVRRFEDEVGVEELGLIQEVVCMAEGDIAAWLKDIYKRSRGFELGTFDASILATTMELQTKNWIPITKGYVGDIITLIQSFIFAALGHVCHEDRVKQELLIIMTQDLVQRYEKALHQVQLLLNIERLGTPITLNHYFNANLQKCEQKRLLQSVQSMILADCSHGEIIRVEDLKHATSMSNVENTVQRIHDILYSYYKVTCKRFVDNVCKHLDHFLISGPITPLTLFSPVFVGKLTQEQLEVIAGEDNRTKRNRRILSQNIGNLLEAKKILL